MYIEIFVVVVLELWEHILSFWAPTRYKGRGKCLRKRFPKGNREKYHGERCDFSTNYPKGHSCWMLNCFYCAYFSSRSLHALCLRLVFSEDFLVRRRWWHLCYAVSQ